MGRNTSAPLSLICTDWDGVDRVHNFLCKYDPFNVLKEATNGGENTEMSIGGESIFGLEDSYSYGDDDKENDNDNDEMRELRYSKIAEFKSVSDQLSASFQSSASATNSVPKGPTAHVSKYDKNQPKLKSKTRLFALPNNMEEQERNPSRPNIYTSICTHGIQAISRSKTHLYSTSTSASFSSSSTSTTYDNAVVNFDYLSILKSSQKLAVIAVEIKEKSIQEGLLASKSMNGLEELLSGTKIDGIDVRTSDNDASTTDSSLLLEEKSVIDVVKDVKQEVQSPYRNLITSSLSVLGSGLIEREVEVSTYELLRILYGYRNTFSINMGG